MTQRNTSMAKKQKKPEDYVFPLAAGLTFFLAATFLVALGHDLYYAAQFIGDLYASNV